MKKFLPSLRIAKGILFEANSVLTLAKGVLKIASSVLGIAKRVLADIYVLQDSSTGWLTSKKLTYSCITAMMTS